jgi:hypothetical protein
MAGRPKAKIDWKRVDELLQAHCSMAGIARIIGIAPVTLRGAIEREFKMLTTDYIEERKEEGTALMREAIYKEGLGGNIIAQIFWLKNRDGWSDKTLMQHEMLPPVQLSLPNDISQQDVKMVEEFFNVKKDDNECFPKKSESLPRGEKADH